MLYDLVIDGASLVRFRPDIIETGMSIGIQDSKIAAIAAQCEQIHGKEHIDAAGRIAAPGFIDFHSHVDGKLFSAKTMLRQGATTTLGGERKFDGEVIRKIISDGFIINHGFFVSHSFTLRQTAGLHDPYREANSKEISTMCMFAEQFFDNGAYGIHFGLEFAPSTSFDEIAALASIAKAYGKIVLIHLRKDGTEGLESIAEAIRIARETGASIHILHLMYMVGFGDIMGKALCLLDDARAEGLDITADTGLYSAFPSCIGSPILDGDWKGHYGHSITEKEILISSGIYAGEFCDETMFSYLRDHAPKTLVTVFAGDDASIELALAKDYVFVSSNAADGPHYENMGHPETSGTFPRLLARYVREKKLLPICEAIKKITLLPAERFGIESKGQLEPGYDADIVIFDPDVIEDGARYVGYGDPNKAPKGIEYVFVNGKLVLKQNQIVTQENAGTMLP